MCVNLFPASHEKAFILNVSFSRYHEFQHSQGNQLSCQQEKSLFLRKWIWRERKGGRGGGGRRERENLSQLVTMKCVCAYSFSTTVSLQWVGKKFTDHYVYVSQQMCCTPHTGLLENYFHFLSAGRSTLIRRGDGAAFHTHEFSTIFNIISGGCTLVRCRLCSTGDRSVVDVWRR